MQIAISNSNEPDLDSVVDESYDEEVNSSTRKVF